MKTRWIFALILMSGLGLGQMPAGAADKSVLPETKPANFEVASSHTHAHSHTGAQDRDGLQTPYPSAREVFSGNRTVVDEVIAFPQENAFVEAVEVTLQPGEETEWHQHHAPMFAYVLEGEVTVTYEQGFEPKVFRAGDGMLEAMRVTHRGVNSGDGPARVLAVFMLGDGAVGTVAEEAPEASSAPHTHTHTGALGQDGSQTPYQSVREIFSGNRTVVDEVIAFPQENAFVEAVELTLQPGEETEWHQHHAPMFVYTLEGEITITYEDGLEPKVFRAGDGMLEAMGVTHRGVNSGEVPVRAIAVFMLGDGAVGTVSEEAPETSSAPDGD